MALQTVLEKLQLKEEKNILVQGLPSSIEKQFIKLNFAKSVTPLLKNRGIDFALVFAISKTQLSDILSDVLPAMHSEGKLWIAYPKVTAKIVSDLCRDCDWSVMTAMGFETVCMTELDNTWNAINFKKLEVTVKKTFIPVSSPVEAIAVKARKVSIPDELKSVFRKNKNASDFFDSLPITNKREYVEWVGEAKRMETKNKRLESVLEKLNTGKMTPTAK